MVFISCGGIGVGLETSRCRASRLRGFSLDLPFPQVKPYSAATPPPRKIAIQIPNTAINDQAERSKKAPMIDGIFQFHGLRGGREWVVSGLGVGLHKGWF